MNAASLNSDLRRRGFPVILLVTGLIVGLPGWGGAAEQLPDASEVTRRMIERSQTVAGTGEGPQYTYEKRALLERLDAAGRSLSSEVKVYKVTLIAGLPFNRLVRIQDRELSSEESNREDAREERFRQRFITADAKKLAAQREGLVTPELLGRYQFVVERRVVLSNRPTLVLAFKPKEGTLSSSTVMDKLLNHMAGRVWIDEADADTARIEVGLVEPLSLGWLGWLASLNQCEMSLERRRMPDGVWINTKQSMLIQCRKLTANLRFRSTEVCSRFQKVVAKR
jgi:hypothetical protein